MEQQKMMLLAEASIATDHYAYQSRYDSFRPLSRSAFTLGRTAWRSKHAVASYSCFEKGYSQAKDRTDWQCRNILWVMGIHGPWFVLHELQWHRSKLYNQMDLCLLFSCWYRNCEPKGQTTRKLFLPIIPIVIAKYAFKLYMGQALPKQLSTCSYQCEAREQGLSCTCLKVFWHSLFVIRIKIPRHENCKHFKSIRSEVEIWKSKW